MKLQLGVYKRIFAWTPIRFLERVPNESNTYEMKTAFLKPVWLVAVRASGGGASITYKSDEVYSREWRESVLSKIDTDFSPEEVNAYFDQVGISHNTHQISEALAAIREYIKENGAFN